MDRLFKTQDYGVSIARLWVMRALFLVIAVLFGIPTWMTILEDWGSFAPLEGVAYSFWGALCLLALVGIRYPLKMLPVLLIQLLYKLIWLLAVGYPLLQAGPLDDYASNIMEAMQLGIVFDIIAIPWVFIAKHYIVDFFRPGKP